MIDYKTPGRGDHNSRRTHVPPASDAGQIKGGLHGSSTEKDPDDWTTGDEAMTGAQASYLKTLSEEAGEPFDDSLTKAEASKRIDALQAKTGRGQ